jgi:N-acetylmuramate 1-kinase
VLAQVIAADPAREAPLYALAADILLHLHTHPAPAGLPDLNAARWAEAAAHAVIWYRFAITGERADPADFTARLAEVLARVADGPRILILRDYHAENLMLLPRRRGLRRLGLLDFQLGQMGQPGYDLVSLLQDARRDVRLETESAMKRRFVAATGVPHEDFDASYAALGAQRALRILGVFARLCLQDGKPGYLALMPRVWGQLQRNLAHPALAELARECAALLPPPTLENLERIRALCGMHRQD